MRVFKDLDMVEYLSSGMPRILKAYSRDAYVFSSRFVRAVFPMDQAALAMEREDHGNVAENRLGENERAVLLHLVENRKASITSLATVVGLSSTGEEKIFPG